VDILYQFFGSILFYIYEFVGNYGLSIILFTILVKLALLPLNIKQTKAMKEMAAIQPEIKKIQTKYKNNKEKQNEETMKLYKEHNVNPMGGCLPLLVQFPIIIGLYTALREPDVWVFADGVYETINRSFLWIYQGSIDLFGFIQTNGFWIEDLGQPDPFYLLPILAALGTLLGQYYTMKNQGNTGNDQSAKTSRMMMMLSPIMILFIGTGLPAGVALYWVVQSIFTFTQQFIMLHGLPFGNKEKA
jgi:YidC/Oxa1 family membrane protein insertase